MKLTKYINVSKKSKMLFIIDSIILILLIFYVNMGQKKYDDTQCFNKSTVTDDNEILEGVVKPITKKEIVKPITKKEIVKPITKKFHYKNFKGYESEYITKILPLVKKEVEMNNHLTISHTIAQACLESNFGKSSLSVEHNNHFGIKYIKHDMVLGKTYANTYEYLPAVSDEKVRVKKKKVKVSKKEPFCTYKSIKFSFKHRSDFLKRSYYKILENKGVECKGNYKKYCGYFAKTPYATDPMYIKKIEKLIKKYKLYELDR